MSQGSSGVVVRRAREEERPALVELLATAMGAEADDRYRRFYAWKHDHNPYGLSPTWVAELDGELVGLRTWLRWEFETADRTWTAVRAVDTATLPAAQGQGVFTRLTTTSVQELTDDGVGFVYNTPNDKSRPGYLKMGWVQLGTLRAHVRPTSVGSLSRTAQARQPAELWSEPSSVGQAAAEVFADDGGARWLEHRPAVGQQLRSVLTPAVLQWRYGLGDLHYRALTDDEHGCVVFRVRRRGPAREVVVCLVLARTASSRAALLRRLAREVDGDHLIEIGAGPTWRAGFVPLPGQGPVLTWRSLARTDAPDLADFDLKMGDVELF